MRVVASLLEKRKMLIVHEQHVTLVGVLSECRQRAYVDGAIVPPFSCSRKRCTFPAVH